MADILGDITRGIFDHLGANASLSVAYPNVKYEGVKPYFRANILPVPTVSLGIQALDRYDGFAQIDVVVKDDTGSIDAAGYVAEILTLFPRNSIITSGTTKIRFDVIGWTSPAVQDVDGYFIPVSIPYIVLN